MNYYRQLRLRPKRLYKVINSEDPSSYQSYELMLDSLGVEHKRLIKTNTFIPINVLLPQKHYLAKKSALPKTTNIQNNTAQTLSLTGLLPIEFEELCADFEIEFKEYVSHYTFEGLPRFRSYKARKTSSLPRIEDKLFFTLVFMKTNPLQEHHAASFGITQPKANMFIHLFIPLLRKTLKRLRELPQRKSAHLREILKNYDDILLDGTERPIQKPTNYEIADQQRD